MMRLIKNLLGPKTLLFLAISFTVLITIALLSPTRDVSSIAFKGVDKIVHFFIHLILVCLWLVVIKKQKQTTLKLKTVIIVACSIFVYGIIIEVFQEQFTTSRTADVLDVVANTTGLLAGLLVIKISNVRIY